MKKMAVLKGFQLFADGSINMFFAAMEVYFM